MNPGPHPQPVEACDPERGCITCSDEAIPMRVVEPGPDGLALCADEQGRQSEVMVDLVGDVAAGDTLLVHAGAALVRLHQAPASGAGGEATMGSAA